MVAVCDRRGGNGFGARCWEVPLVGGVVEAGEDELLNCVLKVNVSWQTRQQ